MKFSISCQDCNVSQKYESLSDQKNADSHDYKFLWTLW